MPLEYGPDVSLGQAMFGQAELDDKRRTARLVATFDALCRHPGGTLPDKLASPAELKALYRLCACAAVTHAALVAAARSYTLGRIAAHDGPVLLVHDATEVHRVVLPYRAYDLLKIVGEDHAHTMLRQSVRYCVKGEVGSAKYFGSVRELLGV